MTNKKASAKTRTTARAEADSPASRGNDNQKGKCKNKEQRQEKNNGKSRRIPWTGGPATRVIAVVARKPEAKVLGSRHSSSTIAPLLNEDFLPAP
jgi:hypothetical protein